MLVYCAEENSVVAWLGESVVVEEMIYALLVDFGRRVSVGSKTIPE
jgi:hypothetical protein